MDKNIKKLILIESLYFVLQILFSKINFLNKICPFGLPFAMVRVLFGGNIFSIIFAYSISKIYSFVFFSDLFICFYEVVIITLYYFIRFSKLKKKPLLTVNIFILCSMALEFYYALMLQTNLIVFLIECLLKIFILNYFYKFFQILKCKTIFFKFSNSDYLYFSLISLFVAVGIYSFSIEKFNLSYFFVSLAVVMGSRILPSDKFFVMSLSFAIGATLASNDFYLLLFAAVSSIVLINVRNRNKYVFAITSLMLMLLIVLLQPSISFISILISSVSSILILIIPQKFQDKFSMLFEINSSNLMFESLRREKFADIKSKLTLMANTLKNMQKDFKYMIVGKISREKASIELSQDVINSCCQNCENFKTCFLENINKRLLFENLMQKAIEKGSLNRDDILLGLQTYCLKEGIILSEINQVADAFLKFEKVMKNEDSSKLIISDELGNFADIFLNFSKIISVDIGINKTQSNLLKETLLNNMIDTKDVIIVENKLGIESINLIAKNEHILKKEMVDSISKFAKNKFKIRVAKHLNYSGLSYASFIPSEKLKMNVAVASKSKENKNGDNVAMTKLSKNKYFIAIADGMGHGESANRISSMVLSLIRSMFEIGFDNELIIQSVNKLIIPAGIENFTSLDACVVDLDNEIVTFIKLGSSVSIIKRQTSSELVACESLPIGIIDKIKPTIIRKHISVNDTIFLASDGIVDSFSSIEEFRNYINDSKIYNLQKYVDGVLFDSEYQNKKHPDDMTIIAINLLKNY